MARHWYLTPTGELKQRRTDWRLVALACGSICVGIVVAFGIVAIAFLVAGAML
jgi:uncharacterized membrane protein (DUF485 family)